MTAYVRHPRRWFQAKLHALLGISAITAGPTVTYTAGSAPVVTGAVTIANSATPTVTELLAYIAAVHAKVDAIAAAPTS
jgi:hypothetical protein